jgi:hypothetical protein
VLVDLVGDRQRVPLLTLLRDEPQLVPREYLACGVVRRVDDDRARAIVEGRRQLLFVERPVGLTQSDEPRHGPGNDGIGPVVLVIRLENHHLVARIENGQQRREHRFRRSAAHRHLCGADRHAVPTGKIRRDGFAKVFGAPCDRILIDIALDRAARGVLDRLVRREIRKALRQVDGVVFLGEPRHLPDNRLRELGCLLRTAWLHRVEIILWARMDV